MIHEHALSWFVGVLLMFCDVLIVLVAATVDLRIPMVRMP